MSTHVVDDRSLEVRDLEVPSFTDDGVADTMEFVELESTVTRLDYKKLRPQGATLIGKDTCCFEVVTYRSRYRISKG